jgi:hypothetical protein
MSFFMPIFKWSDSTWVGMALRQSVWLFPIVETFHLLALALLLGTVTIVSLRLFGLMFARYSVAEVARNLAPWTIGCLAIVLISGWCLFASEAFKCYDSTPFRIKMICLFLAIVYHSTIYWKVTRLDHSRVTPLLGRIAGALSLLLWFSVGLAGRAIGFL